MTFHNHIDPLSGRQRPYDPAACREDGAKVTRTPLGQLAPVAPSRCGVASSRGYATEADHDERDRADECAVRFKAAMCKRAETCGCGVCVTERSLRAAQVVVDATAVRARLFRTRIFIPLCVAVALCACALAYLTGLRVGASS